MEYLSYLLERVRDELTFAQANFPPFNSAHEGWAVIKEELDELWDAVREKQISPSRNESMLKEALQVATMAIRFLIDMPNFRN